MSYKGTVHKGSGVGRAICDGNGRMRSPTLFREGSTLLGKITCQRCLKMMAAGEARRAAAPASQLSGERP